MCVAVAAEQQEEEEEEEVGGAEPEQSQMHLWGRGRALDDPVGFPLQEEGMGRWVSWVTILQPSSQYNRPDMTSWLTGH